MGHMHEHWLIVPSRDPHEPDSVTKWTDANTGGRKAGMSTNLLDARIARLRPARSKQSGQLSNVVADGPNGRLTVSEHEVHTTQGECVETRLAAQLATRMTQAPNFIEAEIVDSVSLEDHCLIMLLYNMIL